MVSEENMKRSGKIADIFLMQRFDYEGDDDENCIDLLTNIQHWCDVYAVDFDAALTMARDHYIAETRDNG